jgi:fibronectin type 3 domain-containing protein
MSILNPTSAISRPLRSGVAALLLAGVAVFGVACGSSGSNSEGSPETTAPATPSDFSGTPGDGQVDLNWSAVSEAETYTVYRSTSSSTDPSDNDPLITGVSNSNPSYEDTEVTNGTDYYYAVTAVSAENEESDPSSTIKKRPFAQASGLSGTSGDGQIKLDWSTAAGAETYNVYRSSSSSTNPADNSPLATGVSDPAYTDMGAQNGTTYYYVVTSVGSDGNESAPSNEVSKTPFSEPGGRP